MQYDLWHAKRRITSLKVTPFSTPTPGQPQHSTGWLLDLGDQDIAHQDLRHSSGELHDVVPHPVGGLFVGDERFIRAVEHADGDNHIGAAIEQIVPSEPLQLAHQRHKAVLNSFRPLRTRASSHPVFSDGDAARL
jgi:hypothetical protein